MYAGRMPGLFMLPECTVFLSAPGCQMEARQTEMTVKARDTCNPRIFYVSWMAAVKTVIPALTPEVLCQDSGEETVMKKIEKMKKIAAWAGILLLAGIYLVTFILGITGKAETKDLLMACIICTVLVPVLMYAMLMMTKTLSGKNVIGSDLQGDPEKKTAEDTKNKKTGQSR